MVRTGEGRRFARGPHRSGEHTPFYNGRWDMAQADGYVAAIRAAIGALETNFGAMRPVAVSGSRLFRLNVGSHAIWARVSGDVIRVVRVLHQRMDPAKHL